MYSLDDDDVERTVVSDSFVERVDGVFEVQSEQQSRLVLNISKYNW